jgi:hypothetical protein
MGIKRWFYTVPLRLRSLFRRSRVEEELDEEIRYHHERQIEELVAKGMSPEEARYFDRLSDRSGDYVVSCSGGSASSCVARSTY